MNISEVRIVLMDDRGKSRCGNERLAGFASITLDHAVAIREIKIINGFDGLFIAFPSRKIASRCRDCAEKNHLLAHLPPVCGGPIEIALITADRPFRWIKHKTFDAAIT